MYAVYTVNSAVLVDIYAVKILYRLRSRNTSVCHLDIAQKLDHIREEVVRAACKTYLAVCGKKRFKCAVRSVPVRTCNLKLILFVTACRLVYSRLYVGYRSTGANAYRKTVVRPLCRCVCGIL